MTWASLPLPLAGGHGLLIGHFLPLPFQEDADGYFLFLFKY